MKFWLISEYLEKRGDVSYIWGTDGWVLQHLFLLLTFNK